MSPIHPSTKHQLFWHDRREEAYATLCSSLITLQHQIMALMQLRLLNLLVFVLSNLISRLKRKEPLTSSSQFGKRPPMPIQPIEEVSGISLHPNEANNI